MRREQKSLNRFKFGTLIGRFPSDGAASMAVIGLIRPIIIRSLCTPNMSHENDSKRVCLIHPIIIIITLCTPSTSQENDSMRVGLIPPTKRI